MRCGIEKISFYPGSTRIDFEEVVKHRPKGHEKIAEDLMVSQRSVIPLWEDPVTMSVNSALPLLTEEDKGKIDLVISATESGVDQEKSISTWMHRFLDLPSHCRTFEIKSACYCATAAIKMAAGYLNLPGNKDKKVLIVAADQSTLGLGGDHEYVLGCGAVAMLISNEPKFLELEHDKYGIYTSEVADIFRPLPWVEAGNAETSLFSYLESLGECFEDYQQRVGDFDLNDYFKHYAFHVPFPGISFRAHHYLFRNYSSIERQDAQEYFEKRTEPSLYMAKHVGGIYSAAVYLALMSLVHKSNDIKPKDRVGIFSYGSGSCAEFYSGLFGEDPRSAIVGNLDTDLERRYVLNIKEYETIEQNRSQSMREKNVEIDHAFLGDDFFNKVYADRKMLVLDNIKDYYRNYKWGSDV